MSPSSPIPASVSALIFCGGEPDSYETQTCERELREGPSDSGDTSENKPNVYVQVFEGVSYLRIAFLSMLKCIRSEMLKTLVETESHLFNLEELDYISRYAALSRGSISYFLPLS